MLYKQSVLSCEWVQALVTVKPVILTSISQITTAAAAAAVYFVSLCRFNVLLVYFCCSVEICCSC